MTFALPAIYLMSLIMISPGMKKAIIFSMGIAMITLLSLPATGQTKTPPAKKRAPKKAAAADPFSFRGWIRIGKIETYRKQALGGYLRGGAEIFLQYGFSDLTVRRYKKTNDRKADVTLELYRMNSPLNAFGVFSIQRDGTEESSPLIPAANWISSARVDFARADFYVRISGNNLDAGDLEQFATGAAKKIWEKKRLDSVELSWLPGGGLLSGSERYIRGNIAARAESPLLDWEGWGFNGSTRAVSARYEPSGSKFIVMDFGQETGDLSDKVQAFLKKYLEAVGVEDGMVRGQNAADMNFLFKQEGRYAALVIGERNSEFARGLIRQALSAAQAEEKSE